MGMGFPALSNLGENPFFTTAFQQKAVPENEFSMKLASTGSSLFLGGTDSSLFTGAIEFHSVVGNTGFWQMGSASILVGSTAAVSNFQTIIDRWGRSPICHYTFYKTFFVSIKVERPSFMALLRKSRHSIHKSPVLLHLRKRRVFTLSPVLRYLLSLSIGVENLGLFLLLSKHTQHVTTTKPFIISFSFNLGQATEGSSQCVGAISGMDLGLGSNTWLLGDRCVQTLIKNRDHLLRVVLHF